MSTGTGPGWNNPAGAGQQPAAGWGHPTQPGAPQGHPTQPGAPQGHPGAPAFAPATGGPRPPAPAPAVARPVVSAILVWVSGLLASLSLFLPWNVFADYEDAPGGGFRFVKHPANAWEQAAVNIHYGRFYGWLMLIAFALLGLGMAVANIAALVALITKPRGSALRAVVLVGVIVCLVATLGVFLGYAALGALGEAHYGMLVYAISYLPGLVGAIGMQTKKF